MAPPHHQRASDTVSLPASHSHPSALNDCKLKSNAVHPSSPPTYFFRSKLPDIDIPDHLPLAQYCLQRARAIPDHPCLLQGNTGKSYTYGEVELYVRRAAAGLANIGLKKGDTVMLLLPNCAEFVLIFLGAAMRGAMVTTCNPSYTQGEIEKQFTASGAKLIVTKTACIDKLSSIVGSRPHVRLMVTDGMAPLKSNCADSDTADAGAGSTPASTEGRHGEDGNIHVLHISELLEADEGGCPDEEIEPDDVVALPFSSGTTGLPKGVMLTHRAMVTSIAQLVEGDNPNLWLSEEDVVLCVLPMFHIYCMSMAMASLRAGAAMAIMGKYELGEMVGVVQREAVTVAPLVPPILVALAKSPGIELCSVRMVTCGAAPLDHDVLQSVRARLPHAVIAQGYGMTEALVLSMSLSFAKQPFPTKPRSCGTVIRNAIMKIVDLDTGASLPHNTLGEICIKGKQIMKGYLNDNISTFNTIDGEGFLHTGDIGLVDEDEELFLVDRIKEIIKYKGFQVPPAELESILISHPMIEDAACVPQKDELAGEVPVAFIVPTKESCISEDEVKDIVAKQVVSYKRLHKVIFVSHIQGDKSAAGKILRKDLRKQLEDRDSILKLPLKSYKACERRNK